MLRKTAEAKGVRIDLETYPDDQDPNHEFLKLTLHGQPHRMAPESTN